MQPRRRWPRSHDHRRYRAVDAAGEAHHDLALSAHQRVDLVDLALDDRLGPPVARQVAGAPNEVADDLAAANRMADLGVELHTVQAARRIPDSSEFARLRGSVGLKPIRETGHLVAMRHPHHRVAIDSVEHALTARDLDRGATVFVLVARQNVAAKLAYHPLESVADSEHRHTEFEDARGHVGRVRRIDRRGPARQDDAAEVHLFRTRQGLGRRDDLGPHVGFAHAARDELGVLRTEINNENATGELAFGQPTTPARSWGTLW